MNGKIIGIITAMKCESQKLVKQMKSAEYYQIGGQPYYSGIIGKSRVVVSVCGVGKVFAAICTQTLISQFKCTQIVNFGVAGSLDERVNIGDVVIADRVVQYDMDTSALGDPIGMISGINTTYLVCDKNGISTFEKILTSLKLSFKSGVIATGDRFFGDEKTRQFVSSTFNAYAGEMEGGAIGQVCHVYNIPFNVVRIISDRAGKLSGNEYEKNLDVTTDKLSKVINSYLSA